MQAIVIRALRPRGIILQLGLGVGLMQKGLINVRPRITHSADLVEAKTAFKLASPVLGKALQVTPVQPSGGHMFWARHLWGVKPGLRCARADLGVAFGKDRPHCRCAQNPTQKGTQFHGVF